MTPRSVQMAKAVTAAAVPVVRGNILAPFYYSWQNNSSQYYTSGVNQGFGTGFLYDVRSFTGFYTMVSPIQKLYTPTYNPKWGQPHGRKSVLTGSFLYPRADSAVAPAIGTL